MAKICPDDSISTMLVACRLDVTSRTLCRYMAEGKLPGVRGAGNSIFQVSDPDRLTSKRGRHEVVRYVGGHLLACTDVASGLSDRRADLCSALAACIHPDVGRLVAKHPNLLAKFSIGLIAHLLAGHGVTVTYTGQAEDESRRLWAAVAAEVRGSDAA